MGINLSDYETDIKEVIVELAKRFEEETIQDNRETYLKMQRTYAKNPGQFLEVVQHAYMDIQTLVRDILGVPTTDKGYMLTHITSGLYEHYHETRVEKLEGLGCCADKSSFIRDKTLKAIKEQKNLSLYEDYRKIGYMKDKYKGQAYWSPKSVKDTDEAIELFLNWYQQKGVTKGSNEMTYKVDCMRCEKYLGDAQESDLHAMCKECYYRK